MDLHGYKRVKSTYLIPPINIIIRPSSVQRPGLFGAIPIALQHLFGDRSDKRGNKGKAFTSAGEWSSRFVGPAARYALGGQAEATTKSAK